MKNMIGEGKKSAKFWAVRRRVVLGGGAKEKGLKKLHWIKKKPRLVKKDPRSPPAIPQLQLRGRLAQSQKLHGWHQSLSTIPLIRPTLFWILAAHGQLDQELRSESARNTRGIMALRKSFAVATSPLCLPTLRLKLVVKVVFSLPDNTSMS